MEFKEIDVPEDSVQQINYEGSFANVNLDGLYEDTLEDIEKKLGSVPDLMKGFPKRRLIHEWPSWKNVGEIDLERSRYLLSTDEILEEMLSKNQG
ncbi:MAG: hypothetical protein O8C66_09215 [Candidatus Methanoperedens sp.]|nr:hypothetical protein [Candidatus Methanoperedens sp.]MCZ7370675.1 hypothetical protein [Candidatus Methanoperedens sp.]